MASPVPVHIDQSLRVTSLLVIFALLTAAGCTRDVTQSDEKPLAIARENVPTVSARSSERGVELRREHDRLIAAYAPVSDDASVIASADTLFADEQIDAQSYLRVIRTYDRSLRDAQRLLQGVRVHDAVNVRQQLLSAIANRIDALKSLARFLDIRGSAAQSQPSSARLQERYRSAWGASVGAARQATNLVQGQRQEAGLEPIREDAFR